MNKIKTYDVQTFLALERIEKIDMFTFLYRYTTGNEKGKERIAKKLNQKNVIKTFNQLYEYLNHDRYILSAESTKRLEDHGWITPTAERKAKWIKKIYEKLIINKEVKE